MSDEELIAGIRSGKEAADRCLAQLYADNRTVIGAFIAKCGGSPSEADEVLQHGVIRVYEQILDGKFAGKSRISTYLFAICRNRWRDLLKRSGRTVPILPEIEAELPDTERDPLGFLEVADLAQRVREILNTLDETCRQLLYWSDGEGRPMKWVAEQLGYSVQAAMNKKTKCRKAMREKVRKRSSFRKLIAELLGN
ncbi:MAG: sigma-70 family RNA polymerase sigma factor [Bacteroidota bacterium]